MAAIHAVGQSVDLPPVNTRIPDAGMGILLALVVLGFAWMLDYALNAEFWTRWTEPAPQSGPLEQLAPGDRRLRRRGAAFERPCPGYL